MKYKVAEVFSSINGEGPLAGELAVFVRFTGCNLQCTYCDTSWANEANVSYREMTAADIYSCVKTTGIKNVTLTGGEPLIQPGILDLIQLLCADSELAVEIETNGSIDIRPFSENVPNRPIFTMDYKLNSSGMEEKMLLNNFSCLTGGDSVKFVVGGVIDLDRVREITDGYNLNKRINVFISPSYSQIDPEVIVSYMKEHKLNDIRLQLQLHKVIWDSNRRGV